jgi:hypothetical protein
VFLLTILPLTVTGSFALTSCSRNRKTACASTSLITKLVRINWTKQRNTSLFFRYRFESEYTEFEVILSNATSRNSVSPGETCNVAVGYTFCWYWSSVLWCRVDTNVLPKRLYLWMRLYGVTSRKTNTWIQSSANLTFYKMFMCYSHGGTEVDSEDLWGR